MRKNEDVEDAIIVIDQAEPERLSTVDISDSILKLLAENVPVQVIASRLNLDPNMVLSVQERLASATKSEETPIDRIKRWMDNTDELLELAYTAAQADPTPNNLYAYTATVECATGLLDATDRRSDPKALKEDIRTKVLEPVLEASLLALTESIADARKKIGELLPNDEDRRALKAALDSVLRSAAAKQQEHLDSLDSVLLEVVDKKKQPVSKTTALAKRRSK